MATAICASTIAAAPRCSARNLCRPGSVLVKFSNLRNRNLHLSSFTGSRSTVPFVMGNLAEPSLDRSHPATRRFLSSTPGAAGRSRKRPRPRRRYQNRGGSVPSIGTGQSDDDPRNSDDEETTLSFSATNKNNPTSQSSHIENDDEFKKHSSLPYPKAKPWRVLWPRPHGEPNSSGSFLSDPRKGIPTIEQIQRGWSLYKETWEDGITGIPTKPKKSTTTDGKDVVVEDSNSSSVQSYTAAQEKLEAIGDNASNNLRIVRKDAQDLLEHTKETTGIRTQDDLKALASEAMKVATECIREFMAGYRKGRDSEIDKMLHEYFQEEEEENNGGEKEVLRDNPEEVDKNSNDDKITSARATTGRKKRRKPKRGIPRR